MGAEFRIAIFVLNIVVLDLMPFTRAQAGFAVAGLILLEIVLGMTVR
jgi:hypothetical protein